MRQAEIRIPTICPLCGEEGEFRIVGEDIKPGHLVAVLLSRTNRIFHVCIGCLAEAVANEEA